MNAILNVGAERLALLLGLGLFFGFAFEEFYSDELPSRPGGVRTFPLLALAGGGLYVLDEKYAAAFIAGLLVVGSWIYAYIRRQSKSESTSVEGLFVVPICNLLAYALGAIALTQPLWMCVGIAVAAVLLLSGRRTLHDWAQRVPTGEIITAGQFLLLVGVVLPLLAGRPAIPYTTITPFGVWLAVVAVSTISYASYLLARYVFPGRGTLLMSFLGGLYSSTATTVVLSRLARDEGMTGELQAGIVAATTVMYLRILAVSSLFNLALGRRLILPILLLTGAGALLTFLRARTARSHPRVTSPSNPLQLGSALVFALLFVAVSMLTALAQHYLGSAGIFALAGVVGITDIDPFVLSIAQGGAAQIGLTTAAGAILIATSSNNLLKAIYTLAFSRRRESLVPAALLASLAAFGVVLALMLVR